MSFTLEEYYNLVADFFENRYTWERREIPRFGLPLHSSHRVFYIPFVFPCPMYHYWPIPESEIAVIPRTLFQKWFGPEDREAKEEYYYRWFDNDLFSEADPDQQVELSYILAEHQEMEKVLHSGQGFRIDNRN